MTLPNIAFVGKAGAGKSTCARLLATRFDLGYEIISFATPLKVMLDTETDRQRLQEFGTDIVRRYDPDAWVRLFLWHQELRAQARNNGWAVDGKGFGFPARWVNDDCRFANELQTLQDQGWKIVEVSASRQDRVDRLRAIGKLTDEAQLAHESENALGTVVPDAIIYNASPVSPQLLVDTIGEVLEDFQT